MLISIRFFLITLIFAFSGSLFYTSCTSEIVTIDERTDRQTEGTDPASSRKAGQDAEVSIDKYLKQLDDSNADTRRKAAEKLGEITAGAPDSKIEQVVKALYEVAMNDPDTQVQMAAQMALERIDAALEAEETGDDDNDDDNDADDNDDGTPSGSTPSGSIGTFYGVTEKCISGASQLTDDPNGNMEYDVKCSPMMTGADFNDIFKKLGAWSDEHCPEVLFVDNGTNINGKCKFKPTSRPQYHMSTSREEVEKELADAVCSAKPGVKYGRWDCSE